MVALLHLPLVAGMCAEAFASATVLPDGQGSSVLPISFFASSGGSGMLPKADIMAPWSNNL